MKLRPFKTIVVSLLLAVGVGVFSRPLTVEAKYVNKSEIHVINTGLDQSAFQNLSSCVLREPVWVDSDAYTETAIDVPDTNNTAYSGADQPYIWSGRGYSVWFCNKTQVGQFLVKEGKWYNPFAHIPAVGAWEQKGIWLIGGIISLFATIAAWIIWMASLFLGPLLGASSFITNPLVTTGWPFVQGIANIGFLLALLFIAFATTLRLESFGVRRMLPRLLIAALLINFSLVITGLLIDVSRLVMASLLVVILRDNTLDTLAQKLLESSDLISINFNLQTFKESGIAEFQGKVTSWQTIAQTLQATALMWGFAIGFIILTAGLLVRYIMLVLLLVVSPLAFLAVALPNTASLANKWWSAFLKYVLYGPIAVFVLLLTVAASQGLAAVNRNLLNQTNQGFTSSLLNLLIVIAMMITAATAGSKLGIAGAGATMSMIKKTPGFIRRNPKTAAAIVGGLATGGIGGVALGAGAGLLGQRASRNARALADEATKPLRKKYGIGKYGTYDEQGNVKKGKFNLGKRLGQLADPEIRAARAATSHTDAAVQPEKLVKADVVLSLNKTVTDSILASGSKAQKLALVQNVEFVDDVMSSTQKAAALADPETQAQMLRTLREIANRSNRPK